MQLCLASENGEVPIRALSGRIVSRSDILHYGEVTDLVRAEYTFDNATSQSVAVISEHFPRWIGLDHRNINPVLDFQISTDPLIVNPWIRYSLSHVMNATAANPELLEIRQRIDKWSVIKDVCAGLEYLHTRTPRPVVHGGISMNTILVDDSDNMICAKLSNFGLEPILRRISFDSVLTSMNDPRVYTPAPEVLSGTPPEYEEVVGEAPPGMDDDADVVAPSGMTPASDIYDLGTWMLEFLSGKTPWLKSSRAKAVMDTMRGLRPTPAQHPGLPETHPAWDLIRMCWAQNPKERPSIRTVMQLVNAIAPSQGRRATPQHEWTVPWYSPSKL
ncbi:hypothetical protein FRB90_009222 [Tulasnella sp. 427]|nr:hypothetical protein FRB90_009222 [Tulasnella sp. 427]